MSQAAEQASSLILVRNLYHWFVGSSEPEAVLQDIDLAVSRGELVSLIGPSGCGKTTLLNIAAGLEPLQTGEVTVAGGRPKAGSPKVGYMFARDALLPWRTALQNVELSMEGSSLSRRDRRDRARSALASVGLERAEESFPAQLSQGMRQRVALARTVAPEPDVLLMDEPFGALDAQTKLLVQDHFMQLRERLGVTVVLVTHDLAEAIALGDRVVIMSRKPGRIRADFRIELSRPRSIVSLQGDQEFHSLFGRLWHHLQEEVSELSGRGVAHA